MKSELIPSNGDPPITITRDVTVVGRREFCDVLIADSSLSKRHCVLVRTDGLLMIRDLASTNGTKVNGQRVMSAALLPNDKIQLGRYKMRVYLGPDDAPAPSEQADRTFKNGRSPRNSNGSHYPTPVDLPGVDEDGFAPPSPPSMPVPVLAGNSIASNRPGSTEPDSEIDVDLDILEDEEVFEPDVDDAEIDLD